MNRKTANVLRSILDDFLPPVIRESRPFAWGSKLWLGRDAMPDFKERAFAMSKREFARAYQDVGGGYCTRGPDSTVTQMEWLLSQVHRGERVLEIGPGGRHLTARLCAAGSKVVTLDLAPAWALPGEVGAVGVAEHLPFADKVFDVSIVAHVIEHVRELTTVFLELERVTRSRVLIVTPRQRFYKFTFDYHLHFFYSPAHLASHTHTGSARGHLIDGDICLIWTLL